MSSFQDEDYGTRTEEEPDDVEIPVFTDDAEAELRGIINGLEDEATDPETAATSLMASDAGQLARDRRTAGAPSVRGASVHASAAAAERLGTPSLR